MVSLDPVSIKDFQLTPQHGAILRWLGEYKGRYASLGDDVSEVLDELKRLAKIESIESSNRLEGIIVEHERIEEIVLKPATPKNRSEQEVAGYRDALDMIHMAYDSMHLDTSTILELHEMVYSYTPVVGGKWKEVDNYIIERFGDRTKIRFKPTTAKDTPEAMERLIEEWRISMSEGIEPLIIIPLFILDFLCIHPFPDGNGRVARLLTLLLLYQSGFHVGRYISLERVAEDTKKGYYDTLYDSSQRWHEGEMDLLPWVEYFWGTLIKAYRELEKRLENVSRGKGWKTEAVREAALSFGAPFSISDVMKKCPEVSRDMVRFVLRQMRDEGVIRSTGIGRGAKWVKVEKKE